MRTTLSLLWFVASLFAQPDAISQGRILLRAQHIADAEAVALKALSDAPNSAEAHTLLGEVLFRKAKIVDAQVQFARALELDPQSARALVGLCKTSDIGSL